MHIYSGNPPDVNKPLARDWNGDGADTTGIYNYTTANFSLDSGLNISFGIYGDIPLTGDWNGNGYDTIGVFRLSTSQFFLDYDNDGVSDTNETFRVMAIFRLLETGMLTGMIISGSTVGSTTGVFYLDIDNDGGIADIVTPEYGDLGDIPIAGDWDGGDNIGVYRPGTGGFFMDVKVPAVSAFDPAGWSHSDLIAIQERSGSDLIDYQILVELNTLNFDFSKALSDGVDIRFAELDITELLDRGLEFN